MLAGFLAKEADALAGPLYIRLARGILAAAAHGQLDPAGRLPTERSLAAMLGISRSTVVAAYELLEREGAVTRRQGSGTWLSNERVGPLGPKPSTTPRHAQAPAPVSFLLANLPANELVREAVDTVNGRILDEALKTQGYEPHGLLALRQAIARYYDTLGLATSPSQILVTTGAQQAVSLLASTLVDAGDPILVEDPTYSGALEAFDTRGAQVTGVAVDPGGLTEDALKHAVAQKMPKFIYVIPLHNPTGSSMPHATAEAIADIAAQLPVTVLEDRTLTNLVLDDATAPLIGAEIPNERSIIVESLSKLFWGGLRVGWIRANENAIDQLARKKAGADLACPVLSQLVATSLMPRIPEARTLVRQRAQIRLAELKGLLATNLPSWRWLEPQGGLSLWVKLPAGNASDFLRIANQYGVAAVPGVAMSASRSYEDHLRLPFVHEADEMTEGIRRLAEAWRAYEPVAGRQVSLDLVT